jgi:inner membrane protein
VTLTGDWPHPAFGGSFLPTHRDVGKDGFKAQWQLSSLATSAQREWLKGSRACGLAELDGSPDGEMALGSSRTGCVETFGVTYIDPVNPYVLSDRASKYGLVFIVLTFVAVGLTEVLRQLRVHPVQYLLVGAGLTLFFLLLVSLSEHIGFLWAYGIASGACTLLLGFYGVHTLRSRWGGMGFGAGIATLFGVMFVLLQREQTALVLGSVMLFVVLALVMVLTRHVDWYELMERLGATAAPAAPAGKAVMPAGTASQDAEEPASGARH